MCQNFSQVISPLIITFFTFVPVLLHPEQISYFILLRRQCKPYVVSSTGLPQCDCPGSPEFTGYYQLWVFGFGWHFWGTRCKYSILALDLHLAAVRHDQVLTVCAGGHTRAAGWLVHTSAVMGCRGSLPQPYLLWGIVLQFDFFLAPDFVYLQSISCWSLFCFICLEINE